MKALGALLAIIFVLAAVLIYSTLVSGMIIYNFWYWFVVPVFNTLPAITFYQALGLAFVIGLFKNHFTTAKQSIGGKKIETEPDYSFLFIPWFTLFFGYLVHLYIN